MKKFIFEADKKQWEKPTEPKYVFCPPAKVSVYAETEAEAFALAEKEFKCKYAGTGFLLGTIRLAGSCDMAIDWNYGYGDSKGTGSPEDKAALREACTK
jgi:hypothetical protein